MTADTWEHQRDTQEVFTSAMSASNALTKIVHRSGAAEGAWLPEAKLALFLDLARNVEEYKKHIGRVESGIQESIDCLKEELGVD